ncbi:hypothetical protein D3C84_933850 [compost metagenome]
MEGITQADQGIRAQFVGQQAGHAPAHRLAADRQWPCDLLAHLGIHRTPLLEQFGLGVGRAFLAVQPPCGHVGELEAQHRHAARCEVFRHLLEERAVHRRAGAMGENQGGAARARGAIPQPGPLLLPLRALTPVNTGTLPFAHACLALRVSCPR